MRAGWVILAVGLAIALQTTLPRYVVGGTIAFDLVLVVVVYTALTFGPVAGLLTGTVAGLVQDALSTGVVGIGGLAKTTVGFLAGIAGTQFIVVQPIPRFVVFFCAALLHRAVFTGFYVLLGLREADDVLATALTQAAGQGVLGVVVFELAELLPGVVDRRLTRTKLRR